MVRVSEHGKIAVRAGVRPAAPGRGRRAEALAKLLSEGLRRAGPALHAFTLHLAADRFVSGEVDQQTVDVIVRTAA